MISLVVLIVPFINGRSHESLSPARLADVKAGLIGASAVLDPSIERASPVKPKEYLSDATRFLQLTEKRVGKIDDSTGDAEIRMKLGPGGPPTMKFRPAK